MEAAERGCKISWCDALRPWPSATLPSLDLRGALANVGSEPYSPSGKLPFHCPSLISPKSGRVLTYGAFFALPIFWLLSVLLFADAFEAKEELLVSKEVLLADLVGDLESVLGFEGRCFCSLLVGDLVGLLAPDLDTLPGPTSTLNCGGGAPFAAPARSNLLAIFLTDPAGLVASVGVDLALFRVCVGGWRVMGAGLREGDWETALGASDGGGCNRCGGLPRVGGGGVAEPSEKAKSSPVRSRKVADIRGGLLRSASLAEAHSVPISSVIS